MGYCVHVIDSSQLQLSSPSGLFRRVANRLFSYGFPIPLIGGDVLKGLIKKKVREHSWDIVWLEKALDIDSLTLSFIKNVLPDCLIIGFSPDDMNARHNQSQQFLDSIDMYDLYFTTKSYNVQELQRLGCRRSIFVPNGYDPDSFAPTLPNEDERSALGGDVGFIGTYEDYRANMLLSLARHGISVRVWGNGWQMLEYDKVSKKIIIENRTLNGETYSKACNSFKINLNFLRKVNRDLQTTRSIEIPASGGFMLAERTREHQELFKEGVEAEFFSSQDELVDKCNYYLSNEGERLKIATAGYKRCIVGGYSNAERLHKALSNISYLRDQ